MVCLCVRLLDTLVTPVKTAEPIRVPFGVETRDWEGCQGTSYQMGPQSPPGVMRPRANVTVATCYGVVLIVDRKPCCKE